jgi:hypothetical protein
MGRVVVVFLMLMIGCAHKPMAPDTYPVPRTQEDCMRLFRDINEIQARRHVAAEDMNITTRRHRDGHVSQARYHRKREAWLQKEGILRIRVTHLYDLGYNHQCF